MNLHDIVRQFRRQSLQEQWEEHMRKQTIKGHPSVDSYNDDGVKMELMMCAECESVRSVLYISRDRWYCTTCRNSGDARPTQIALTNPARRS